MELHHYQFNLADLFIDTGDIEQLMGYAPGTSPDPFPAAIQEVYDELAGHCSPEGGFISIDNPEFDLQANETRVRGLAFHTDRTVTRMLRKSEAIAFLVCTAGPGITEWTKEVNGSGDPVRGFVIDAFGSLLAEAVSIKLHAIIREMASTGGKLVTNLYSPGYCDWPVKDQQKLFSFFPEYFCGITLSGSSLMHPIKSLSGMTGIGSHVRYQMYTCDSCRDEHCTYRKLRRNSWSE